MATGGCEETSDEIFNFKCTPCSKINRQRKAVKYCVECQGYCCQSCVDMHQAFPAIQGHKLLDKSSFKRRILTTNLPSVPTEICTIHEIKILDMYCGNHEVVGCTSCMALHHRNCTDVQLVSDVVETMFKKTDVDETNLKLREKNIAMEKIKTSREALLEELNKSKTDAVNEIEAFRADMETMLRNMEKESIKEVNKEYQTMNAMLLEEMKKSEKQIIGLGRAADNIKQSDGNVAQQFVSIKTAQKIIAQTDDIMNSFDAHTHAKVSFAADQSVLGFLQHLKTFGSVNRNTAYSVKAIREMNIKVQSDTSTCTVYGSCLTQGGKLLLPDSHNNKLKRVDISKLSVEDYCDLPCAPNGVCCIGNQEAVVTLSNTTLQFVSLGNHMKLTHDIKLNHSCFGIAYKDDKLLITDNGTSLYIHDMAGTLLQTISKDSSGNDMLTNCRQIAFSDSGDKIYVADIFNNIVTLDRQGKHCNNFIDSDLTNGTGVCTDRKGNVFVCAIESKNIMQIKQNGQKVGIVVKSSDGLIKPWSITFSPEMNTLFVTEGSNDNVKVFELQ
ncbi:uncharacterized protein LOC128556155 isoform X2 [Mercenaria mercenaria]|uniref:uncharacterized protein LOC128556155 isoform X2 n=1 Tax=Mercenaria mercenaria TaxID=6596 RepID=UPI00234E570B|nr:uncharacterized protein LOC128556155 isoform X2 [Mercenaria mercenaria]